MQNGSIRETRTWFAIDCPLGALEVLACP